jgi:hypothetical protein
MFVIDSRDTLSFARERAARLGEDVARKSRSRSPSSWLRRHACRCRIEIAPLAHRPA